MGRKKSVETLDRSLQDLHGNITPVGNALLAREFGQILPVIPRSTLADEINDFAKRSIKWGLLTSITGNREREIAARKKDVDELNDIIHSDIQSETVTYKSVDIVVEADEMVMNPTEFSDTFDLLGMPAHVLQLKVGVSIIMLRNINQPKLCNGTQLAVKKLMNNVVEATILTRSYKDEHVLIPRIPMIPTDMPFQLKRLQYNL
ncbi:unnamed protein product [Onchocerca ochengi]|uniref:ATP-dependent DNA helicase n=1 Tax=Onchocerca ochengi TaxID=42157 RepID=A0A182EN18_ONCOC|nr:unnamed protein product [Onchocerca ochengi]